MEPVNAQFLYHPSVEAKTHEGLMTRTRLVLVPGLPLYRFASSHLARDRWFNSPWWIGQSPFDAIQQFARGNTMSLGQAARLCLAIDESWSQVDLLIGAHLSRPLVVWAGTPKTQRPKIGERYQSRLEPNRAVTQYYIPGFGLPLDVQTGPALWQTVFHSNAWSRPLPNSKL
jgi:hypothetical protein